MPTPYVPSRWLISAADVSDDPDIFPFMVGQMFLQHKTPVWSTKTDMSVSGIERRRAMWSYPIWRFKVGYEFLFDTPSAPEINKLHTFFNAHLGGYKTWFFYDRTDNTALSQAFGTGDGVKTTFQLSRTRSYGGITFTEPVRGISGTPTIYINGTPTSAYTIGAYGAITFTTPPAAGAVLSWSGKYFFLCRFLKDELDTSQMMNSLWNGSGIEFQTVKK